MCEYNGRDPERIDLMLEKLSEAWKLYPDMRFGQLIATCAKTSNIAGVEDEEMLKDIEKYIEIMKKQS